MENLVLKMSAKLFYSYFFAKAIIFLKRQKLCLYKFLLTDKPCETYSPISTSNNSTL